MIRPVHLCLAVVILVGEAVRLVKAALDEEAHRPDEPNLLAEE